MLILVKHAMPLVLATSPARDWPLSEAGRGQCAVLGQKLKPYAPEVVVASVELKATETGRLVAGRLRLPFYTAEGLHEHDRTKVGLLPAAEFERSVRAFFDRPRELVFGGETAEQAGERFQGAVARVLEQHADRACVVIVAHGTVISLFVARATGREPFHLWKELGLPSFVVLSRPDFRLLDLVNLP